MTAYCSLPRCLEIIDDNAESLLKSDDFLELSDDLLAKILARDTLKAKETSVYSQAVAWAEAKIKR